MTTRLSSLFVALATSGALASSPFSPSETLLPPPARSDLAGELDAQLADARSTAGAGEALVVVGGLTGAASLLSLVAAGLSADASRSATLISGVQSFSDPRESQRTARFADQGATQAQVLATTAAVTAVASVVCLAVGFSLQANGRERIPVLEATVEEQAGRAGAARARELRALRQRVFGDAPAVTAPETTSPEPAPAPVPDALRRPLRKPLARSPSAP